MRNLKRIRLLRELTQLNVQMDTGINQSVLSKYETGQYIPTTENLLILARYYDTSLDYLMDLTDQSAPYPIKKQL